MIEYIYKSSLSLAVFSALYFLVLRHIRIFKFNRIYLLFSLLYSFIIPFINFRTNLNIPAIEIVNNLPEIIGYKGIASSYESVTASANSIVNTPLIISFIISSIFLFRYALNLIKILIIITKNQSIQAKDCTIILSDENKQAYSIFKYIIINRDEYLDGKISKEILIHEQAHCKQLHTVDLLFLELVVALFWFNPFVWLFRFAIRSNHEFLSDSVVLLTETYIDYQKVLIREACGKSPILLASNFSYRLIKKRMHMMTKKSSNITKMAGRIIVIPIALLLLFLIPSCEQESSDYEFQNLSTESKNWSSILEKHNIEFKPENLHESVFFSASFITVERGVFKLENGTVLIKKNKDQYTVLKSPLIFCSLKNKTLSAEGEFVTIESYNLTKSIDKPVFKAVGSKVVSHDINLVRFMADSLKMVFK